MGDARSYPLRYPVKCKELFTTCLKIKILHVLTFPPKFSECLQRLVYDVHDDAFSSVQPQLLPLPLS